jgi:hypothetical protein
MKLFANAKKKIVIAVMRLCHHGLECAQIAEKSLTPDVKVAARILNKQSQVAEK